MRKAQIYYARMDEFWRKEEKLDYLEKIEHIGNLKLIGGWKRCAFLKIKLKSNI